MFPSLGTVLYTPKEYTTRTEVCGGGSAGHIVVGDAVSNGWHDNSWGREGLWIPCWSLSARCGFVAGDWEEAVDTCCQYGMR